MAKTKQFLEDKENELIDKIVQDTKSRIVSYIKNKYCIELSQIDDLVTTIVKNVIVLMADSEECTKGSVCKEAEKWFKLSGIKNLEFHRHSVYGFARSFDSRYYTVKIPKKRLLTSVKIWLATKLFKIV